MDFSKIDELYDVYKNDDIIYAEQMFDEYYAKYQQYGNHDFINSIKEYIKQQASFVANYFVSNKDDKYLEHNIVTDVVAAFENLLAPVDGVISAFVYNDADLDQPYFSPTVPKMLKPHDLFNINPKVIEDAVESDDDESIKEDYDKIKDLISYVKKNKILDKIYKDDSWHEIDFEKLIYSLYDYIEDKNIFKTDMEISGGLEFFLFEKINANCSRMLTEKFDKFRPNLNSTKQIRTDFGKLIFCRNLLLYYQTGIMPDVNGMADFSTADDEHMNLIDDFRALYSKSFDENEFKMKQGNFICDPEVYRNIYKLEDKKCVKVGDKLIAGFIVSCTDEFETVKIDYLVHVQLNDVNNSYSNYEMQINIVPHGDLEYRLQLMRLDNWEHEQTHRNVAKKLATTTHIHIYNEFDILRGKTNGAYDIAYNIEGRSTEFESSLKTFLKILDLDKPVSKEIYETTLKALEKYKKSSISKEI